MAEETSTQTETVEETQEASSWNYGEGVKGEGDRPEWFNEKYTTVADQAKGYNELQTKLGGFIGAPEEYTLAEGLESDDTALMSGIADIGKKYNMSNDMYNDVVKMVNEASATDIQSFRDSEMEALGNNAQTRIDNINSWLSANASQEFKDFLGGATQTAGQVEMVEGFIKSMKGSTPAPSDNVASQPKYTQEGYEELLSAKDENGRLKTRDPRYLAKTREYATKLVG